MFTLLELVLMLGVIFVAAEIFTNALEHLGERLRISEGVTGSLFAAVATAMPETMVPVLAIVAGTDDPHLNAEIGVGAILGAPLMLSTLAMCLLAVFSVRRRGAGGAFHPEPSGMRRDLDFFLAAFALATVALFVPQSMAAVRTSIGLLLVLLYFIYVLMTVRASARLVENGHATEAHEPVWLSRFGLPENLASITAQLVIGFALLIAGAKGFIHGVEGAAALLGISPLLLSLLIIPIATELPEKVNSVLWIRRNKDTLAFGNITGAMVFQGSLLPALGILLTPWALRHEVLTVILVTLTAAVWLRILIARGTLRVAHLWANGVLYALYLVVALGPGR